MSKAIGTAVAMMAAGHALAASPQGRTFSLPESNAVVALPEFARQAGVQIVAPGEYLQQVRTPAVQGTLESRAALRQLLTGTGLSVVEDDGERITLASAQPMTAALHGHPGVGYAQVDAPAAAPPADAAVGNLDAVVVTGARGVQRTVTESPTPIDVIGAAELEKTGRPGLLSALNDLVPSFNAPAKSGNGTSYVIATGGV
ncbi:STN domain-containing protein, partial [Xanthomonas hortorum pv. vitians]|nr:STN domain-containing protein [Xanthomonas hortorum pv. vitians]